MCSRGQPCEGCSKRGQAASCRYAPNAIRNKPRAPKVNIQERLDNLESMLSMMVSTTSSAEPGSGNREQSAPSSSSSRVAASYQKYELSVMSASNNQEDHILTPELPHRHETGDGQVSYVDPSHWMAIMDEIKEVREHISAFDRPLLQEEPEYKNHSPEKRFKFLFSTFPAVDIEEALTSLPPRQTCDALVSQYFNAKFMAIGKLAADFSRAIFAAFLLTQMT